MTRELERLLHAGLKQHAMETQRIGALFECPCTWRRSMKSLFCNECSNLGLALLPCLLPAPDRVCLVICALAMQDM